MLDIVENSVIVSLSNCSPSYISSYWPFRERPSSLQPKCLSDPGRIRWQECGRRTEEAPKARPQSCPAPPAHEGRRGHLKQKQFLKYYGMASCQNRSIQYLDLNHWPHVDICFVECDFDDIDWVVGYLGQWWSILCTPEQHWAERPCSLQPCLSHALGTGKRRSPSGSQPEIKLKWNTKKERMLDKNLANMLQPQLKVKIMTPLIFEATSDLLWF